MHQNIIRESSIHRSPRVQQVEGIFDVSPEQKSKRSWQVSLPIEERDWSIGLIVGPSGCGKTTVARTLFGDKLIAGYDWPEDKSILDGFPKGMSIKEITNYLSSVGFSSPPSWLRPFHVLSNGEQFRVTMARILAESQDVAVVDEFTSVVDRTVAKIGSAAIAKTVRRNKKRLIAVTCHFDVEEWLQPDWVYLPAEGTFHWRSVQSRPPIELVINRTSHHAWHLFKHHHYLNADISKSAWCFTAFWEGIPVAFDAWLPFVGRLKGPLPARRGHRTVVLPDYQGVGIGRALFDHNASMWAGLGTRVFSNTAHPAEIQSRTRYGNWRCIRAPSFTGKDRRASLNKSRATERLSASFEWVGKPMDRELAKFMLEAKA